MHVIYEAHVRGLTMLNNDVAPEHRGKFLGVSSPWMIEHYKRLGVTHVQLMPVFSSKGTYWGYDPTSWFTLNRNYGTIIEFIAMLKELHANGIGVILDVVYNHTHSRIDGAFYYDWDVTGCGNCVDVKASLKAIISSMRYWMLEIGVDGMRFDLANVLGREGGNFNPEAEFFKEAKRFSDAGKLLIAEPWDIAEYSLGRFPSDWLELNGSFRDQVRSGHMYRGSALPDSRSVAFITCHDGFTLNDLVSYNYKHNLANGENNRDGCNDNKSYNFGVEGPTDDETILHRRELHKDWLMKNLVDCNHAAILILAGDEVSNSQNGNNNAYNQDNPTGWINWDGKFAEHRYRELRTYDEHEDFSSH